MWTLSEKKKPPPNNNKTKQQKHRVHQTAACLVPERVPKKVSRGTLSEVSQSYNEEPFRALNVLFSPPKSVQSLCVYYKLIITVSVLQKRTRLSPAHREEYRQEFLLKKKRKKKARILVINKDAGWNQPECKVSVKKKPKQRTKKKTPTNLPNKQKNPTDKQTKKPNKQTKKTNRQTNKKNHASLINTYKRTNCYENKIHLVQK